MKKLDYRMTEELFVSNVTTLSGVRPKGRGVESRGAGRTKHGLLYLRSGSACFQGEGETPICIGAGEVVYIPKYQKYKMQYTGQNTDFILVNFDLFGTDGEELSISDGITVLTHDGLASGIDRLMSEMDAQGVTSDFSSLLRRKELAYRLLRILYTEKPSLVGDRSCYPQIAAGVRMLERRYTENLPISCLAEESKISLSSFRSLFVKQYGMSPVQYRNHLRLELARRLLAEGTYTVSEVAYACGFENIGYFCRYYKRMLGEAPGEMKKRSRER